MLVIHLKDTQEQKQPPQDAFYQLKGVVIVCLSNSDIIMSLSFFFGLHNLMRLKLWVIWHTLSTRLHLCLSFYLPLLTRYLSCTTTPAVWNVNAGPCLFPKSLQTYTRKGVCLCMLARQRETLRNWNLVAPPLPCPTGHAGVHVCGSAWLYSPLKPGLMGSRPAAAEAVLTDKRVWVSTCLALI